MRSVSALVLCVAVAACASGTSSTAADGPTTGSTTIYTPSTGGAVASQIEMTRSDDGFVSWIPADPDDVWDHLSRVYIDLGLRVEDMEAYQPSQWRIIVHDHRASRLGGQRLSRLLHCGNNMGVPREDQGDVRIHLSSRLAALDDGTQVTTRFEGRRPSGALCSTNGRLERDIMERILTRLVEAEGPQ